MGLQADIIYYTLKVLGIRFILQLSEMIITNVSLPYETAKKEFFPHLSVVMYMNYLSTEFHRHRSGIMRR